MKPRRVITLASLAGIAYYAYKNREQLRTRAEISKDSYQRFKASSADAKAALETLQAYQKPLQEMAHEAKQTLRTYQQSIAGNIAEIKHIQEKQSKKG